MVPGLPRPLWACNFCELIGRKKACDVSVGTWLRLIALPGRAPTDDPPTLPAMLARLPASPCRNDGACPHGVLWEMPVMPVLAVPGREVPSEYNALLLLAATLGASAASPPSSVMMSVIRDDMMLGGPGNADRGNCGKPSSPVIVGERARGAPSPGLIVVVADRFSQT